ncbi:MAG TPA: sulfite exporter TauE/SafE family protein, partial [Caulobacteraceae bacterium]|nr:sulfite exporter TauE/SafE family protein [Caulobacteraceae bacterium]
AALTAVGLPVRTAASTKNVLAAVMNASAVAIFVFSRDVAWLKAFVLGAGAIVGGQAGAWMLRYVNEQALRIGVVVLGLALTIGLFLHPS